MSSSDRKKEPGTFVPETLVKQYKKVESQWQSDDLELPGAFEAKPVTQHETPGPAAAAAPPAPPSPPTAQEHEEKQKAGDTEIEEEPAVIPPKKPPPKKPPPPKPAPAPPPVDLSNYVEISDVKKKVDQAFSMGLEEGKAKAEDDFGATAAMLLSLCQQLDTLRETIITNSNTEMQNFALAIAEKILRISVKEQDKTIIATIEEAIHRAVRSDEFTVYVHPDDYEIVGANVPELISQIIGLNNIVLKKDPGLERGGTKIESDNCTIDASIASQFEILREEVKKHS